MLTACRFSEFDTSVICHAVQAFTLFRLVSTSCKICFKALSIGTKGTKIKVLCEHNAHLDSLLAYIVTPRPDIQNI